ncbi:MAG: hypothetical protein IT561_10315 [Alphaproteobacteria bacterium]|nr:hypothetical protein [Alphaproteobacteria bacterium]
MFDFDVVTGPTHGKPQPLPAATAAHPAPAPTVPPEAPPPPAEEAPRERRAA